MKFVFIIFVLMLFSFTLFGSAGIENPDKPIRGKWHFKPVIEWEIDSAGSDMLVSMGSVIVDSALNVYFIDSKLGKIFVLDRNGKFIRSFGKRGEGPGEYKNLFNIYLKENTIIVPDMGKFHYFSLKGDYIKSINPGSMIFASNFIDRHRILFQRNENKKDKKVDSLWLRDLSNDNQKKIAGFVKVKPKTATSGNMTLTIYEPILTSIYENRIYFSKGNRDRYEIRVNDFSGKELFRFGIPGRKKIAVTEEMKRKKFENIVFNNGKMPKNMVNQMIKNEPDFAPFFKLIHIEPNGMVYVYVDDPADNRGQRFDIFSAEGRYLYTANFKLPDGLVKKRGPYIQKGSIYVVAEDEDGESKLMKFKVQLPNK